MREISRLLTPTAPVFNYMLFDNNDESVRPGVSVGTLSRSSLADLSLERHKKKKGF
jgi:hypothetical protein